MVPVFKAGEKTNPSNYRPISLTCIACKMLEHIILRELNKHLYGKISSDQHGFREGLSSTTQLVGLLHEIMKEVDKGRYIQAAFLDFSKAFDRVSHSLLLQKLKGHFAIPMGLLKWIESFLTGRRQRVLLNGAMSEELPVTSGVPQGSVLGPTLFLMYINDITDAITCHVKLFADDLLIFDYLDNALSVSNFQRNLDNLEEWAKKWKMKFNVSKCNAMVFGKMPNAYEKSNFNLLLAGENITVVEKVKYLGVTIRNSLKWDTHVYNITTKAYKILGLIKHTLYNAPTKVKLVAYKSLCRPLVEYASEAWDPYTKKLIEHIELFQNKAIRFILDLKGICSISDARNLLEIETLSERRKTARTSLLMKIISGDSESTAIIRECFTDLVTNQHDHFTRLSQSSVPFTLQSNLLPFHNSFVPRTTRDLRLSTV